MPTPDPTAPAAGVRLSVGLAVCRPCGGTGERRWLTGPLREYAQQGATLSGVASCARCSGTGTVLAVIRERVADGG